MQQPTGREDGAANKSKIRIVLCGYWLMIFRNNFRMGNGVFRPFDSPWIKRNDVHIGNIFVLSTVVKELGGVCSP